MPTWISDHERLTEKGSWVFNFAFLPFKIQVLYGRSVSPELRSVGRVPALNSLGPGQVLLSSGGIPMRHLVCIQLLFPKAPNFYTLILSLSLFFLPVWFPWKCRQASQKKKAGMHPAHRQHVLFLESVELWTCPEMSAWTGPERQGKDPDGRCKTQLSSRTSHSDRLQSTCLS